MKPARLCLSLILLSAIDPAIAAQSFPTRELGKPQTKEEYDAYVAITQATDPQQRAQLSEKYIQDFPNSGLTPYVHQIAATTYQQMNNFEKLAEHGEATLEELPDSPVILTLLANGYAERGKPDLALERGRKALASINALQPPAQMDPAQFKKEKDNLLATVYSSMGVAYLAKETDERASGSTPEKDKYLEPAILNFNKAIDLNPMDEYSYFRLGIVYTLKNEAEKAIDAYVTAVAIGGSVTQMAADNAYKILQLSDSKGSPDERLEKLVEARSSQIEKASGACTGDGQQYVDCILARGVAPARSGSVEVKGYYRKDGTYVRPHTRSSPRR